MHWNLYDYRDQRGRNAIADWCVGLQKRDFVRLAEKIDRLGISGHELCPGLAGPLNESRHLYKIRVNGSVAVRLLLCKGPIEMELEYTLLIGAFERDDKLPEGVVRAAELRREEIIRDP